jgi:hypothetical protein
MGAKRMDTAAGTKNIAGGAFLSLVVDKKIGRGRGRVVGPVDVTVSTLDIIVERGECVDEGTYQK